MAAELVRRFDDQVSIVEPFTETLPEAFDGTGAQLLDIDRALDECDIFVVLVDHDVFRSIPVDERASKRVYDTRGIWLDQPQSAAEEPLRLVS